MWNENEVSWYDTGPIVWPCPLTTPMTLTLELKFQGQSLKNLYLRNRTTDWHGTKRMWVIHSWPWYWLVWPWWAGLMYRIVTGVTSDVGVPSTYLVRKACPCPFKLHWPASGSFGLYNALTSYFFFWGYVIKRQSIDHYGNERKHWLLNSLLEFWTEINISAMCSLWGHPVTYFCYSTVKFSPHTSKKYNTNCQFRTLNDHVFYAKMCLLIGFPLSIQFNFSTIHLMLSALFQ